MLLVEWIYFNARYVNEATHGGIIRRAKTYSSAICMYSFLIDFVSKWRQHLQPKMSQKRIAVIYLFKHFVDSMRDHINLRKVMGSNFPFGISRVIWHTEIA